uniref:Uncharacterized protein n=1 Tax=Avena sativa TaxID=4498 RepID=A0ACD5YG07_AVESA
MDHIPIMVSSRRGSYSCKESCHRHCQPPHSAKYLCLYLLLSLILSVLVAIVLLVIFVTRLKKPTFVLQSIQMDKSFSLRSSSSPSNRSGDNATTSSSCSVASLLFAAQNPNGIGIRYSAADLGVAYANESVGAMDVPVFYQPPRSSNVTVLMHAVFEESNLSRLVVSELSAQRKLVEIRIAGRIDATTHIMNFPLPKIQFTLDCTIATNYTDIILREGIKSVTTRKALKLSALPHVSQKCSIKLDMRSRDKTTRLADLGC